MDKLKELETLLLAKLDRESLFNPGASDEEITDYESKVGLQLPLGLKELYKTANGQVQPLPIIDGYWFSSLTDIYRCYAVMRDEAKAAEADGMGGKPVGPVKPLFHHHRWIPFLEADNQCLAVDLDPAAGGTVGQVIELLYDDEVRTVLTDSIDNFIRTLVKKIKSEELRYNGAFGYFTSGPEQSIPELFGVPD